MVTAEELVVSITSDGTQETQDDLEGVEGAMEDTADSAGNSAEELEGFSKRFSGAMSAAVAALAVGAAGLLSQVPVIGELMSGLFAVVEALAFQMDSVLRPSLSGVTDFFFDVANSIFEAEGAMGTIIGVGTTLASILSVVGLVALKLGVSFSAIASTAATAIGVLKTVGTVIAGLVASIGAVVAAKALLVAAVVGFAAAYLTNWRGVRDSTNDIVGSIIDTVVGGFTSLVSGALDALSDFGPGVRSALSDLAARFTSWAGDLASDAFNWGRNLIDRFIAGIRAAIDRLRDLLDGLRDIGATVGVSLPDTSGVGGGGSGGGSSGRPRFGAGGGGGASTGGQQIDGRQISESTGRYRSDPGRRRGI